MKLVYIVAFCFIGLSQGNEVENPLLEALTGLQNGYAARDPLCNINGVLSNARCLSQTHFIYNIDPLDATPFTCPVGTVCVDLPGICYSGVTPVCWNKVPLDPSKPKCTVCDGTALYACISQTHYTPCGNGEPLTQYSQQCPTGTFCKIDTTGATTVVCAAYTPADADCSNTVVTPTIPRPKTNICTAIGLFPVAEDGTCKSYFSYYTTSDGQLLKINYTCSGNLIFNHSRQKCVPRTTCNCP